MSADDRRALELGRMLLVLLEAMGLDASATAPSTFDQRRPPPEAKNKRSFLDVHRAQIAAGTPGWTCCGATRSVTAEAWRAYLEGQTAGGRRRTRRAPPAPLRVVRDLSAELDRELGIRAKRAAQ